MGRVSTRWLAALAALIVVASGIGQAAASTKQAAPENGFEAISCPSATFCGASDDAGNILTTTAPKRGHWTVHSIVPKHQLNADGDEITAISCPAANTCVAVDDFGYVISSAHATTGPWSRIRVGRTSFPQGQRLGFFSVSCPTTHFCAATDIYGDLETSTDPTGPASAWRRTNFGDGSLLNSVSCPSAKLCVLADDYGTVYVSTDPVGGKSTYRETNLPINDQEDPVYTGAVACPSVSTCVVIDSHTIFGTADPTAAAPHWTKLISHSGLRGLSCSLAGCVAIDARRTVASSQGAGAPPRHWALTQVKPAPFVDAISCPTRSLCVAADDSGGVSTSSGPRGRWTRTPGLDPTVVGSH